jgi:hypothetical protein
MKSFIIKNAEPADNNICPYCKDENVQRLTPNGSDKSLCFKCNKWFKAKLQDVIVRQPDNIFQLRQQYFDVMEKMRIRYE